MKYRIRKLFALTLALSMLLSMIPLGTSAESLDEFEDYETLEEIPFEFELEPGDLPFEQLKDAVLAAEDIPYCIDPALAEARGHVNRLYLQEPDDYTVMFQNRDGSKTIYVFSHPVKGMTMSTTASIQVNGSVISFSGTNAITSRLSELSDYNIGYSEIAYIPNGILSADGINLTEDARGWARGESTVSALAYNMSGEAAAEYAASVTVPDADVAGIAAVTPGITITPSDPAPLGGMTVMSLSSSDLAGLMSLKNMATNRYLTMTNSSSPSLSTSSSISAPYSRWFVQYDSMRGYVLSNINNVFNTYLGRMSGQSTLTIGPKSSIDYVFGLRIVSTYDSTVTIGFNDYAIDSTLSIYQRNPDDDTFPTACEWKIYNKQDITLASSISCSATRTEECGSGFYLDYTVYPINASYYEIGLYYASTGQSVEHDTEVYEGDEYEYFVNTPGTYTVYYKDSVTGIQSQNFTLTIVTDIAEINLPSDTRIEQKGVGFSPLYILEPSAYLSPYDIRLYYASDNIEVSKNSAGKYVINTAGVYTVYYKDSVSGVRSANFLLVITEVDEENDFAGNKTYSIRPVNAPTYYLSMSGSSVEATGYNSLVVSEMSFTLNEDIKMSIANTNQNSYQLIDVRYERWNTVSRLFKFDAVPDMESVYMISAILSTSQATRPNVAIDGGDYDGDRYDLRDDNTVPNTINYSGTIPQTKVYSDEDPNTYIIPCNMGSYYVLVCLNTFNSTTGTVEVLKYVSGGVELAEYSINDTSLRWYVDHVGVNAPLIMQTRNYFCGYTNVLQILYGAGYENIISGNDLNEKIEKIATDYGQPSKMADSGSVYSNILSKYVTNTTLTAHRDSINHFWHPCSITQQEMVHNIEGSLDLGWAPMILSFAGNVPFKQAYYNKDDEVTGHYIVVIGYDQASDCVIISNCHYADKANGTENQRMFGIFAIPASDFYNAVGYLYTMS